MEKDTDTVADVVRAGKNATPGLKSMQTALEAAQTIAERLQDHELAARILEHSKSKDLQGLTKLLQKETRGVKLEVELVKDFTIILQVYADGHVYNLCIGPDCLLPNGQKSPIVFSEEHLV